MKKRNTGFLDRNLKSKTPKIVFNSECIAYHLQLTCELVMKLEEIFLCFLHSLFHTLEVSLMLLLLAYILVFVNCNRPECYSISMLLLSIDFDTPIIICRAAFVLLLSCISSMFTTHGV